MTSLNIIEKNLRPGKHSETLLINQLSQTRSEKKQDVYKFGFGQSPFPVPNKIIKALSDAAHRKEYMSVQGHKALREAIVKFHQQFENKNWDSEQIIIGAGSKILLFCIMAAFEKADILLPAPSWVSYEPQAKLAGHKVTWLTTSFNNKWHLSAQQLTDYCESRNDLSIPVILVFNYPSNPTGQTYTASELKELAAVMKKYNIIVIADEIYSLLTYDSEYSTLEEFYPEGCIVSSGLSKWCGAGGWRLGFHHIPKQLGAKFFQAVIGVASETYSCAPSPIQIAATQAYSEHALAQSFLIKQTTLLREISTYCCHLLKQSNVNVHNAQGGFYLFPQFDFFSANLARKNIHTSEQLTSAILDETGVALLPGSAFGMEPSSLTVRLAFVDFDGQQIWNESYDKPKFDTVKQGIKKLCHWLEKL